MTLLESKRRLREIWPNLVWQPIVVIIFLCILLFFLSRFAKTNISWAVGAGSLASSCFVVFTRPNGSTARPEKLIGAYLVAILIGELISLLIVDNFAIFQGDFLTSPTFRAIGMLAAVTVGIAMVIMVLLNFEHPPATGMALVIILDVRDYDTLIIVFVGCVLLALMKRILRNRIVDLF